jgi:hypothetical protein
MTATMTKVPLSLVAAALLFFAHPAECATDLQPGLWQETETGSENGKPAMSETSRRCMTAEEAAQPSKAVVFDAALRKHCRALDFKRDGDVLTIRLQCGQQGLSANAAATFIFHSPQHYSGTMKIALRLGTLTLSTDKKIDAQRIGDCPK